MSLLTSGKKHTVALSTTRFNFGLVTIWDGGGVDGTQSHALIALPSPGPCGARHQDNVEDLLSFVYISSVLMGLRLRINCSVF
jgi:hypothetical protein